MLLSEYFAVHPRVAIGFSGGVDSAYLVYAAQKWARQVRAYYVKTDFQPAFEWEDAQKLARELDVDLRVLSLDVLADNQVAANPPNRCYYCKRKIFGAVVQAAKEDGFYLILDGTNASDQVEDRPGMKALDELSVESPLRLCGLTKAEIRRLSKEAGLFTWNKPAYACLATRMEVGYPITKMLLARTERAEEYLIEKGFSDFRVRTREEGRKALLELTPADMARMTEPDGSASPLGEQVIKQLEKEYQRVEIDARLRSEENL